MKRGRKASIPSHSCPSKPQAGLLQGSCTPALVGFSRVVTRALAGGGEGCKCLEGLSGFAPLETSSATKPGCTQAQAVLAPADFCMKGGCCSVGISTRCFYICREPAGCESFLVCGQKYQSGVKCRCTAQLEARAGGWSCGAGSLGSASRPRSERHQVTCSNC